MPGPRDRLPDGVVIFDEAVRGIVGNTGAEVVIKAACGGTFEDGLAEIHVAEPVGAAGRCFAILCGPFPAKVPLADARGGIAILLQEGCDGQPVRGDERLIPRT